MTNIRWPLKAKHLLLYWREIYHYDFKFMAELLRREFKEDFTKNACIGMHHRLIDQNKKFDKAIIKDFLPGPQDHKLK